MLMVFFVRSLCSIGEKWPDMPGAPKRQSLPTPEQPEKSLNVWNLLK
jgi:hypothetical protein